MSAANSNKIAERLGKSAFYSAEIIGENILRSMVAKLSTNFNMELWLFCTRINLQTQMKVIKRFASNFQKFVNYPLIFSEKGV